VGIAATYEAKHFCTVGVERLLLRQEPGRRLVGKRYHCKIIEPEVYPQ
jgi:hypothetical protein